MKKLFSMLLALLLLTLPALAEAHDFSPFDHVTGWAGGSRYMYYEFPDISLYLPADWDGLFTVEQTEKGISFYQTASYEKFAEKDLPGGGFLFELCASEGLDYKDLPRFEYLGYSDNAKLHFYLVLPTDYPAYPEEEIMSEYNHMAEEIQPVVVEMAKIRRSMEFYTDGIESTDAGMS